MTQEQRVEVICRAWWPNHWPHVPNVEDVRERARQAIKALAADAAQDQPEQEGPPGKPATVVVGYYDGNGKLVRYPSPVQDQPDLREALDTMTREAAIRDEDGVQYLGDLADRLRKQCGLDVPSPAQDQSLSLTALREIRRR